MSPNGVESRTVHLGQPPAAAAAVHAPRPIRRAKTLTVLALGGLQRAFGLRVVACRRLEGVSRARPAPGFDALTSLVLSQVFLRIEGIADL